MIEPPLLLGDDGVLGSFSLRGNALNYGWLNQDGKPLALPLQTGGNYEVSKDLLDNVRRGAQGWRSSTACSRFSTSTRR